MTQDEAWQSLQERVNAAIAQAVAEERAACVRVAENFRREVFDGSDPHYLIAVKSKNSTAAQIANEIRQRGQ